MKKKFDIDNPKLRENPFTVPDGYFLEVRNSVSERISSVNRESHTGVWSIAKPQLILVSSFVIIFFIVYGAFSLFSPSDNSPEVTILSSNSQYLDEGFLRTSFVDFFDFEGDTVISAEHKIDSVELITYISENIDIITLASLE
ncbi:MAG: hypothetical protein CVU13_07465 [Bacteroidetes bacterium HGW-Bacteroidetes-8]|jgi:hypothetical protein|nr:MAG: hypothetical protein CVU13_07465 [Bacteroidetes bacterium HGW-Bacteroidetes-8]